MLRCATGFDSWVLSFWFFLPLLCYVLWNLYHIVKGATLKHKRLFDSFGPPGPQGEWKRQQSREAEPQAASSEQPSSGQGSTETSGSARKTPSSA